MMETILGVVIVLFTIYAAIRIVIACIKDTRMTEKTEEPKVVVRNTSTTAQFGSDG
jgi:hypothetical protein